MSGNYEEISRLASKGDNNAIRELFKLAELHESEGNFKDSSILFRESAIAYRISASRNLARIDDVHQEIIRLMVASDIYKKWIESNPNGLRELPYSIPSISRQCISDIVVGQLLDNESFIPVFYFLEDKLSEMGMKFFSPGGSIQRRVCGLLAEMFGLDGIDTSEFIRNTAVRVGLDLLADEVAKRCLSTQENR